MISLHPLPCRHESPLAHHVSGTLYPMTTRGNVQAAIYADDADRRAFVDLPMQIVQRYH